MTTALPDFSPAVTRPFLSTDTTSLSAFQVSSAAGEASAFSWNELFVSIRMEDAFKVRVFSTGSGSSAFSTVTLHTSVPYSVIPSMETVMLAVPAATAFTIPFSTVTIFSLLEAHTAFSASSSSGYTRVRVSSSVSPILRISSESDNSTFPTTFTSQEASS